MFPELRGTVKLIVSSPPYIDTTNYLEDQWLRLWFLGGPPETPKGVASDDRHRSLEAYWNFLTEAWAGVRELLMDGARLVIRIGGRKLQQKSVRQELQVSLEMGLSTPVELVEFHESRIRGNQVRSFRPGAKGCQVEFDLHFILS
jgi:methylase of polypeptide subunit release factors